MARQAETAERLRETDVLFHALAHASRRQILLVLHYRGGEMLAGDIAARFSCSWPTTTRHLRVLREAGLIEVERDGRRRLYRLNPEPLKRVVGDWLACFDAQGAAAPSS